MSTEFRTDMTWSADTASSMDGWWDAEWVFTRWGTRAGVGFDFGSRSRFDAVMRWAMTADAVMVGEDGSVMTTDEFVQAVVTGSTRMGDRDVQVTATFGEFVGTVAVGSGEMFARCGWDASDREEV